MQIPGEQKRDNVMFYTWGEHQQGRGAKQVASALVDFLDKKLSVPNNGLKKIRLFSDSCVGQNKNFTVVTALSMLALKHSVVIEHTFHVRGHSYMPADRAFGRVELILRKKETILLPVEYYTAFSQVGNVLKYPHDWKVYNYGKVAQQNIRKPPSFKITESNILLVQPPPASLTVKNSYAALGCEHTLLKRGRNWNRCVVEEQEDTNCVKDAKKRDVTKLLAVMGHDGIADVHAFYTPICQLEVLVDQEEDSDEDEAIVDVNEEAW